MFFCVCITISKRSFESFMCLAFEISLSVTLTSRAQELCRESRGGRPGLPVPNHSPRGLCGRKATLNLNELVPEPRSLVKVEVVNLGSLSQIIVLMLSLCGCKATLNLNELVPGPRRCVKVEVAVLGSPSLIAQSL